MDGNGLWEEEGRDARNLCSPPSMATVDVQSAGFSEVCAVWCQDVAKMTKAQTVGREFEAAAAGAVRGLFLSIGVIGVMTVTVRVKPGLRKSWALVSFERPEQAAAAVAADHEVQPVAGGEFTKLRVEPGSWTTGQRRPSRRVGSSSRSSCATLSSGSTCYRLSRARRTRSASC